jgi:transposase
MFNHEELFTLALQLKEPFFVKSKDFNIEAGELHLYIDFKIGAKFQCPVCHEDGKAVHDTEEKVWRHLNFFQYKAFIHCRTPRVKCSEHGVRLIEVPWAAPGSGFTLLFEALVLELAKTMPVSKMAQILQDNDTRVWRIIKRYVDDAREQADYSGIRAVGIDETSCRKGHKYVTLFADLDNNRVVHVVPGKDSTTIHSFSGMLKRIGVPPTQIQEVCTDMSIPFKKGLQEAFPWADVTYDKFHVIKAVNDALDKVRRNEQHENSALKHSRYLWLHNPQNLKPSQKEALADLTKMNLKTARAYRIKLSLQDVYSFATDRNTGELMLKKWYGWAIRSRIDEIKDFARMVKSNWNGILNYFNSRLTSGIMESINSLVQAARNRARGYRNVRNFITMIYLLAGKLELKPKVNLMISPT